MLRSGGLLLLLLTLGLTAASADERGPRPPGPKTVDDAVVQALAAWKAKDEERLTSLAARDEPDPWLVAEALGHGGHHDVAEAFARAAPRASVAKLPTYVATRRKEQAYDPARALADAMNAAFGRRDWTAAVALADGLNVPVDTVTGVRVAYGRAVALGQLGRIDDWTQQMLAAGDAARAIGWLQKAIRTYYEAGGRAWGRADWPSALRSQQGALAAYRELGDESGEAGALANVGLIQEKQGHYDNALEAGVASLALMRRIENRRGVAGVLGNIGIVHMRRGDYEKAQAVQGEALALHRALKDRAGEARTLTNLGILHEKRGRFLEAIEGLEQALSIQEELHDARGRSETLGNLANCLLQLGDYPAAKKRQEEALALKKELKDRAGIALTLGNLGVIHTRLADYPTAMRMQRQALEIRQALGDRAGIAATLGNLGAIHLALGEYPAALRLNEQALALMVELGDRAGEADVAERLGLVHLSLGDNGRALAMLRRALARYETLGMRGAIAWALLAIGELHRREGDLDEAHKILTQALHLMESSGNRSGIANVLIALGAAREGRGDPDAALRDLEKALALGEELADPHLIVSALEDLGGVYANKGDRPSAIRYLERARRMARAQRDDAVLVRVLAAIARLRLQGGDAGRALAEAQTAMGYLEDLLGGLGEVEGSAMRQRHDEVFAVGALAAARLRDGAAAMEFLESGRAGQLLESLQGRESLRYTDLPEGLRDERAEAGAAVARTRHAYAQAARTEDRERRTARLADLRRALDLQRAVEARIQRDAKRQAEVFYPRAATLEAIQAHLGPKTALVVYGLCLDEGLALVLTKSQARIEWLGAVAPIVEACEALELDDPEVDETRAVARLRALLVKPLALPGADAIERVLVSPEGPLCYLPFGLLLPDRIVALTPSGTTHVLLSELGGERGTQVLALGDPDYENASDPGAVAVYRRGRKLLRLKDSRAEANAVGDVPLLGPEASEGELRRVVATQKRWRAVHFACHGLIDVENPLLSSLALTARRESDEDGFLTGLDLMHMQIPADLVVLSACELAKGRIWRGEGIVGLTRMFMYAGAPRVICSLWKVNDKATQALMVRFYELWNPRAKPGAAKRPPGGDAERTPGAAEALRQAQAYVRSQPGWEHPYFWAAWVLWGLPD